MEHSILLIGEVIARFGRSFRGTKTGPGLIPFVITVLILIGLSKLDSPLTDKRYAYRTYFGIVGIVYAVSWLCGVSAQVCFNGVLAFTFFALLHFALTKYGEWRDGN